ncbi:MAG TPA: hypothetical protein VJL90_09810, partial [Pseudorhodoplanes sp.]|nr:hypothetical protein [Pseudorhodoplanes sp.]
QRITTLISFVRDEFPVDEDSGLPEAGRYFRDLPEQSKLNVWRYPFVVEFVPQENVAIINDIFNRINKNVAKLSHQELRHAQFSGDFIATVEAMSDFLADQLPDNFPRITKQSRRQMKDVETAALLFVFLENGERSTSQADLDQYFADREEAWADRENLQQEFQGAIRYIRALTEAAHDLQNTRLRNQAEFYSLFAAVVELTRENQRPLADDSAARLLPWAVNVTATPVDQLAELDVQYVAAARAASNDPGPRRIRINRVKEVMLG